MKIFRCGYLLHDKYKSFLYFKQVKSHMYCNITAGKLKVGHKVLFSNGKNGIITSVATEELDEQWKHIISKEKTFTITM